MATSRKNTIVLSKGVNAALPAFKVIETEDETYIICLEANGLFRSFRVLDAPDTITNNRKRLKLAEDLPLKTRQQTWDEGRYSVGGQTDKADVEQALLSALDNNGSIQLSFSGRRMKGDYILEWDRKLKTWYLKKKSSPAEVEEEEEIATVRDENAVSNAQHADSDADDDDYEEDEDEEEIITPVPSAPGRKKLIPMPVPGAGKVLRTGFETTIGEYEFEFRFYKAIDPAEDGVICLISSGETVSFVMRQKKRGWEIVTAVVMDIGRLEGDLSNAIDSFLGKT